VNTSSRQWTDFYSGVETEVRFMNGTIHTYIRKITVDYTCVPDAKPVVKKNGNEVVREYNVAQDQTEGWEWRAINFMESYQKAV
jgi:hypothetical protein